ncbi:Ig-like domain-containing protein [Paraflavitalea sp. CAU 1676]|uniref:Ig-like domain-containing protein n=1 Tax=Paraflavitalea sp. CAU 1676 TaxID=3032598 RepID=UPI0023DC85B9|nr:Ig-like domain-containing protein [Paraflavitalea sp. CAU 1676]MDF2192169.1 Ig-like domain-containing protein [Paraflavitalea sp. CAU 1676]
MLGLHTGASAFEPGKGRPPGVPDINHPGTKIIVVKDSSLANGIEQNTVTATVVDEFGNPVAGAFVAIFVGTVSGGDWTGPSGSFTYSFGSIIPGDRQVEAKVNGIAFKKKAMTYFKAPPPDVTVTTTYLDDIITGAKANNTAINEVYAHITDKYGNPIKDAEVDFTIASGVATNKGPLKIKTDAAGNAYLQLVSTVAGTVTITAKVNGVEIVNGRPATVQFVADDPSTSNPLTLLTVVDNNRTANGVATNSVKAHLVDANGNPVSGANVTFEIVSGTATFTIPNPVATDAAGNAIITLSSTVAGNVKIRALVNGSVISGSPVGVSFLADVPSVANQFTGLLVMANGAIANNTASDIVTARIRDANGNAVNNASVEFFIYSGVGSFLGSSTVITNPSGLAAIRIVSTVADTVLIVAKVNGVDIINGSPAKIWFVPDVPSTSNPLTALLPDDAQAIANNTDLAGVKAHVVDANGNPVKNTKVTFSISGGTASGSATLTSVNGEVYTDANGDAIIKIKSPLIGTVQIIATVNGQPILTGSPQEVEFVADVPAVNNPGTYIVVSQDNALANGVAVNVIKVHVVDALGNPVKDALIKFTRVSGTATFTSPPTLTTDDNGEATVTLNSTVAGKVNITATVNGVTIVNGSPAIATFVADVPSTTHPQTTLLPDDPQAVANNIDLASVKAHVVDANGNPVKNAKVVFVIDGGTAAASATLVPVTGEVFTDDNGDAFIKIKSPLIGKVMIKATVEGQPITNGSPQEVEFIADVPAVNNPGTYIVVTQDLALANGLAINIVKVHVVDALGNPVKDALIKFTRASGTATFTSPPTLTTDDNGDVTVTLSSTVAGKVNITATVNGVAIVNGSPAIATFVSDVPEPSNPLTTLSVVIPAAPANGTAVTSVKAHIVDANGNPVKGASVEFFLSGAANIVETNPVITDDNGDAIITLNSTVVGIVSVTAKVNGVVILNPAPGGKVDVEFTVDKPATTNPATRLIVKVTGAEADGVALNEVQAHIEDAQGNPVPNATVTFAINRGTATFSGPVTLTTDANGDVVITLFSNVAGEVDVVATVGIDPIVNGSPATVIFVSGKPSNTNLATRIDPVIKKAPADDIAFTSVKAHVADINGNPVVGAPVQFSILNGTATIKLPNPVVTDANGDAIIELHSAVVGIVQVEATILGPNPLKINYGSPAEVEFVVGDPSVDNAATLLSVVTDNAEANGTALNSVKAHIADAAGHPVKDAVIVFSIESGTANIVETNPILTDANGDAVITLNSTVAGKVKIIATVNGTSIKNGSPATVTFVAGKPEPTKKETELIVVTNNASANGVATNSVKAHVVDFNDNPVPGAVVTFAIATGSATIVETGPFTTDAKGEVVITLTSTVGGVVEITAKVDGADIVNGSPASVTFTTDPDVTNPETKLVVITNNAIADGNETNSVKAHVVDANGSPLALKEVFFRIESGDATVLTVQPVLTDVNGDATILLASKTAGSVSVTAKVGDKPITFGSPAKLRFVPVDIYVPKVFTPNNDGNNDVAKPIVVGLTTFHYFSIYNRWGNLLFTTKDPNAGWDGRFKGVLQPVETYLWIAEGVDRDKKKVVRRGMISLVR